MCYVRRIEYINLVENSQRAPGTRGPLRDAEFKVNWFTAKVLWLKGKIINVEVEAIGKYLCTVLN